MLDGIETIFENRKTMLTSLKKKSYAANTESFLAEHGHYIREMTDHIAEAENKEAAAEEIGRQIVDTVKTHFVNKRGKIDGKTQSDLNLFLIYYVFPGILKFDADNGPVLAEGICRVWRKSFKDGQISYTDYDSLYHSFQEKIFGIF